MRSLQIRKEEYKRLKMYNDHLLNSFKKYGFENFHFEEIDRTSTVEELNEREIYWINFYNSTNKLIGYNIMAGGRNSAIAEETKVKMRLAKIGTKQRPDWIANRIPKAGSLEAKKYGTPKTEEQRKHLSENSGNYWLGKSRSKEHNLKVSQSKKGQLPSNLKQVIKYNTSTGEELARYISTTEASRQNPDFHQSKISRICNRKANSKQSFSFKFA